MADVVETTETPQVEAATDVAETEVQETAEETSEETSVEAAEEAAAEPSAETAAESAEETAAEPSAETADEPAEESAAEAAEETAAEAAEETAAEPSAETAAESADEATDEVVEPPKPTSPYDLPGDWYVIHSYSGYENKVKANLETRIQSMHMEDRIFEVHIPMEDVVEFKGGKKVTVPKKVFPGYILVRMSLDDDSWYAVRNTPGVTGFVAGNAQKPTPLSRREVERFLGVQEEEDKGKPRFKPEWDVGEQVRVVTGPFADFNGVIEELNVDQQKVVVLVNIFGRDTPVELGFEDIQKN